MFTFRKYFSNALSLKKYFHSDKMKSMTNEEILQKIKGEREFGESSLRKYRRAIELYTNIIGENFSDLINEAIKEEEDHVPWRDKKIKTYLIKYRNYLFKKYKKGTAKNYFISIIAIYRSFEIELHPLPPLNKNNFKVSPPLLMKDLLTKNEINKALNISIPVMESLTLGLVSMGIDKSTALNIKIGELIEGTTPYHSISGSVEDILYELFEQDNVVPTFYLKRPKTNKDFFTFASPEFVKCCCKYLLNRHEPIKLDSPLFAIHPVYVTMLYENYNNKLGLGKAGEYNRLRGHMLRKYHATNLNKSEFLNMDMIDELQGREKQVEVRKSYYLDDPVSMKKYYIKSLPYVTIRGNVNVLDIKTDEFIQIERENKELKERTNKEDKILEAFDGVDPEMIKELFKNF